MLQGTLSYTDAAGPHTIALDRPSTSIGRSPSQNLILDDPCVSRQHAVIVHENGDFVVIDQKSSHGVFLNSIRTERAILKPGDMLQMGSLRGICLRLCIGQTASGPSGSTQTLAADLLSGLSKLGSTGDSKQPPAAREMEQLNWLLRAARQLNESGGIEDILGALLQLTLQLTGVERGFVFLPRDGEMRVALGLNSSGAIVEEDSTVSRTAMQKAVKSHSKFSISDTLTDDQAAGWESILFNNIRSVYCIPLRTRTKEKESSELLGLLYLDSKLAPGSLTQVDHELLDTIATEAGALLHNAHLAAEEHKARQAREELSVAARIHSSLMSATLPTLSYAVLQAKSIPCLAIGGDFYDAVVLTDCVCITLADVSGKGVSAAIVAATLQGIIHAQLLSGQSLPEIASLLNQFLCARNVGKYATLVMLKLYPDGRIEYINCGHIQPLSIVGTVVRRLEEGNLVVGLIPTARYSSTQCSLQPGERLLLMTDGLTEAENTSGTQFGDAGLDEAIHLKDVGTILNEVVTFQAPRPADDDCTLVEICYTGS